MTHNTTISHSAASSPTTMDSSPTTTPTSPLNISSLLQVFNKRSRSTSPSTLMTSPSAHEHEHGSQFHLDTDSSYTRSPPMSSSQPRLRHDYSIAKSSSLSATFGFGNHHSTRKSQKSKGSVSPSSRFSTKSFTLPLFHIAKHTFHSSNECPSPFTGVFYHQNLDIVGVIMQFLDYKTRQAAAVVNRDWYTQFLLVIEPTRDQYLRVLKSRHHYMSALHLYQRRSKDDSPLFEPNFESDLPLRCFSRFGCYPIVKELLALSDVSPDACNQRALRKASKHGHFKCCKLLLSHAKVKPTPQCIIKAMDRKHFSIVKLLLDDGRLDPAMEDGAILHRAASCGQLDLVHILLKCPRINPAACENRALRYAAYNGHADIVKLLLKCDGVDPTAQNNSALRRAAKRGHIDVVEVLLDDGRCDPATFLSQALQDAREEGHHDVVKLLCNDERSSSVLGLPERRCSTNSGTSSSSQNSRSITQTPHLLSPSSTSRHIRSKIEDLLHILHPRKTIRRTSM